MAHLRPIQIDFEQKIGQLYDNFLFIESYSTEKKLGNVNFKLFRCIVISVKSDHDHILMFASGANVSSCTKLNLGVSANGTNGNGGGTTTYLTETKFSFQAVDNPVNGDSGKQQKIVRAHFSLYSQVEVAIYRRPIISARQ